MTMDGKVLFVLKAADRALDESLRTFGVIAFVAMLPGPFSYQIPIWVLPALFMGIFASPFVVRLIVWRPNGREPTMPAETHNVSQHQDWPPSPDPQGKTERGVAMPKAAKQAALEALVVYSLVAFVGSLPEPIGYPVAVWMLPASFLAFFLYEWGMGRRRNRD